VGRDRFPTSCGRCGSHILDADPPQDGDRYGTVSCIACGLVLAFVAPLARSVQSYVTKFAAEGVDDVDRGDYEDRAGRSRRSWYGRRP